MGAVERCVSEWVDLTGDLIARPRATFPHQLLSARLHETFGCHVVWSWIDGPGCNGFELHLPIPGFPTPEVRRVFDDATPHHPVLRWYAHTGGLAPMTVGRVPDWMVTTVARDVLQEHFVPLEAEHHLVITVRSAGASLRAFVLARPRADFSDEELRVATALQPLLILLDRQIAAYGAAAPSPCHDLTGRELAVLRLLAQGLTAATIASRLTISERTVHRHLHATYRKLGAHDRLTAVLVARDAGLLPV